MRAMFLLLPNNNKEAQHYKITAKTALFASEANNAVFCLPDKQNHVTVIALDSL